MTILFTITYRDNGKTLRKSSDTFAGAAGMAGALSDTYGVVLLGAVISGIDMGSHSGTLYKYTHGHGTRKLVNKGFLRIVKNVLTNLSHCEMI